MKTFYFLNLGCKVNTYETSLICSKLADLGYKEDKENPDVFIINTCSVTHTADQKSRQMIRKIKKNHPSTILCVMGCYAQGNAQYIKDETDADIIIGTSNRHKLIDYILEFEKNHQTIIDISNETRKFVYEELGTFPFIENVRSFLKVQDGCDNFCSYCIIPYRRGRSRSRDLNDCLLEARNIVKSGIKEIVISGIHIGRYGKDLGNITFSDLLEQLCDIEGLERITVSSIEESEIDDKFVELFKTRKNIARHLHIPLQAGSERILSLMNRRYDKKTFLNRIRKIKEADPDVMIATDVIVGFPSETDEEFNETVEFIKECGFNMLHVFPYSPREGTVAAKMKDQVPPEVKKSRVKVLTTLSDELYEEYKERFVGKTLNVLVESYDLATKMNKGKADNYIDVTFKGSFNKVNTIVPIVYKKD